MVGKQMLSGNQAAIQFKVSIALCTNFVPETDYPKGGAYRRVSDDPFVKLSKIGNSTHCHVLFWNDKCRRGPL
jgi:hypothetical protein